MSRPSQRYVDFTRLPTGSKSVLVVLGALVVLGILGLVKIFPSTPRGFLPEYRMSALDKLQAASLARSARRESADGRVDEAVIGWQAAIANDPGDPGLHRGLIETLLAPAEVPQKHLTLGAANAFFLLRLTQTNAADLDLTARLLSRYGLDGFLVSFLQPGEDRLTREQASAYLKALFHLNSMEAFASNWSRNSNSLATDPEMRLYLAAWQAGWGPPSGIRVANDQLAAALTNPATANLARRLTLSVAASRSDIHAFERALQELSDARGDRIRDHLAHWRLLVRIGQRDRAVTLARDFATPAETAGEVAALADAYNSLGLTDSAATLLESQMPAFNYSPEIWQRLGELYLQKQRWGDLRALAFQVRASDRIPLNQIGLTWYWEGLAELNLGRPDSARENMKRVAEYPPEDPATAFRIATGLQQNGFPDQATQLLTRLEKDFGDRASYWLQVVVAAHESKRFDIMEAAARRGYALATNNPVFINNYAACLLVQRTNAPLAVQLTLKRLSTSPNDAGANLNHALALLQNGRLDDAERILNRFSGTELTPGNRTILDFARFELNLRRGNREAALKAYRAIDPSQLMPPQVIWLEKSYSDLTRGG
ncbi:MAG: hypothetical protein JNL10_05580 [Verrucomicrobiales bacterium]|nr:hypothetical protein [Verrucomicrobiales bacterium]